MISLPLDEAYCLDFLSILEVKLLKSPAKDSAAAQKKCNFYFNNIAEQIGDDLMKKIVLSAEYKELLDTNRILFEIFQNCKRYEMNAATPDALNFKRFQLKNKIQKKFFGTITSEQKLGYSADKSHEN